MKRRRLLAILGLLACLVPRGHAALRTAAPQGDAALRTAAPQGDAALRTAAPQGDAALRTAGDDFLQRVRDKILNSQPFQADFIQQVYVDEEKTLEESGTLVFADRSRMKWQYLDPAYKTFILKNGAYSFYDRENNQLMKGRIGAQSEQLIWELLFSDRPGKSSSWDGASRTIRLRLDGENGVEELKIKIGADDLPERVEQTAVDEVTTVYLFRNYRSRIALAPDAFDLSNPPGVEIIEEHSP